jgi:FKBP-type peptidyl-prolyl cis-trans isomerase 2
MTVSPRPLHKLLLVTLGAVALALLACSSGDAAADPTATPTEVATTDVEPTATANNGGGVRVAEVGDSVQVHYRGTRDNGEEFDSSSERGPLGFVVGAGQMIVGFDAAVRGMALGESRTVRLEPAEAYGEVDPARIIEFPIAEAPDGLQVGDEVFLSGSRAVVTAVTADTITVDANHELAGQTLTFEIELLSIE